MNFMLNKRKSKKAAGAPGELSALPQNPLAVTGGGTPPSVPSPSCEYIWQTPPFPKSWIRPCEYNDFDKWLSPTDDAMPGEAVAPKKSCKTKRQVFNLESWLEAWNIYLAIRIQTAPKTALQLVKYQTIVLPAVFCLPGCIGPEVRQAITGR